MLPYNQLSLADVFSDCQDIFDSDKPKLLNLLQSHINLDAIVSPSFRKHFYASTGRTRKYSLHALLWAPIIQRIFSIPADSLLLVFLRYSSHLRDFCGFDKIPDASKITRFKFVCPKIKWIHNSSTKKNHRECQYTSPCTKSSCSRMVYTYPEKNLRAYSGTIRGTKE